MLLTGFFAGDIMVQRHKNASYCVGGLERNKKHIFNMKYVNTIQSTIEVMCLYVAVFSCSILVQMQIRNE